MRVLLCHTFHHQRGGDSTYARGLTRLLEGAGHTVVPLAMRHPDNDPSPWETRFVPWVDRRSDLSPLQQLASLPGMLWSGHARDATAGLIRDVKPDVVHLQHVHRHLTPSVLDAANRAGVPVFWTVHDYELVCPQGHLFRQAKPCEDCRHEGLRAAVRHRCKWGRLGPSVVVAAEKALHRLRGVWERVDRFLCPSAFLAEVLVRFGVPAHRVFHQPNFLETRPDWNPHPGDGWLVAGRLAAEKGVDVAIDAARRLPDHRLVICGTGPDEAPLRQRAGALANVVFLGHLPRPELLQRIREAGAVAVPSRWHENFPYAVLEAQAEGRAVVASRMGGIPEQVSPGIDGELVPPDDPEALAAAIGRLLTTPSLAMQLGDNAARRVRKHLCPERHLEDILQHYRGAR